MTYAAHALKHNVRNFRPCHHLATGTHFVLDPAETATRLAPGEGVPTTTGTFGEDGGFSGDGGFGGDGRFGGDGGVGATSVPGGLRVRGTCLWAGGEAGPGAGAEPGATKKLDGSGGGFGAEIGGGSSRLGSIDGGREATPDGTSMGFTPCILSGESW